MLPVFDLETVSVDISEDFSLEFSQEDFADKMEAAIADGTIIASKPDSDLYTEDENDQDSGEFYRVVMTCMS